MGDTMKATTMCPKHPTKPAKYQDKATLGCKECCAERKARSLAAFESDKKSRGTK